MQPQENDESDDSKTASVHEGIEPDPVQIDEDGNHLERGQEEERQRTATEQD
jgi:hypothetical protein